MKEIFDTVDAFDLDEDVEIIQLVGMKLGDEEYAIDVLKIQEIIRTVDITVVPRMDSYILGVMNLRGKVIPVIDLRLRFNLERSDFDKSTRIIVVRFEKQNVGFVVDAVTAVIRINKEMVEPTPPLMSSVSQEYILGICKYDDSLIILLDIDRVVNESSDVIDSQLRQKMLGPSKKTTSKKIIPPVANKPAPSAAPVLPPAPQSAAAAVASPVINAAPSAPASSIDDAIAAELAKREAETDALNQKHKTQDNEDIFEKDDSTNSIDDMIAAELAKCEEETAKLNKKKRSKSSKSDIDDVLNDALNQGDAVIKANDTAHVEQNDLDALIAAELIKREAETDALNKKHKKEKKN